MASYSTQYPVGNFSNKVYWLGADGNVWFKNETGAVSNMGRPADGGDSNTSFSTANGYSALANKIDDPVNPPQFEGASTTTSPYGTATGSSTPAYNHGDLAYLDEQQARLQAQQGYADKTQQDGYSQLDSDYNQTYNRYNEDKGRAVRDLGDKRTDTQRQQTNALGRIDTNAMTLGDSLRRRLGMASGLRVIYTLVV